MAEFGIVENAVANRRAKGMPLAGKLVLIAGHQRKKAARLNGWATYPTHIIEVSLRREKALNLALNNPQLQGRYSDGLPSLLAELQAVDDGLVGLAGFTDAQVAALIAGQQAPAPKGPSLADRFGVPPFSVLDARQGYWQERKRAWLGLGFQSEIGRGENLLQMSDTVLRKGRGKMPGAAFHHAKDDPGQAANFQRRTAGNEGTAGWTGTSVFDPVLCELVYRWFCPPGGRVLDPFAGGSVRGIVAGKLGRSYAGIDLSAAQVAANRAQGRAILGRHDPALAKRASAALLAAVPRVTDPHQLTPIERRGDFWLKRDDLFDIGGANGAKVRAIMELAAGAKGIITCGDRQSTQLERAALVAKALGIGCRVHTAAGEATPGMLAARESGAEVLQHKPGYLTVVRKRAEEDAAGRPGWKLIPWANACPEAVAITARQVQQLPAPKRIVVPVGSGATLAGILHAMQAANDHSTPVLGVQLGADPRPTLQRLAPQGWDGMVKLVKAGVPFHKEVGYAIDGVQLDPIYEAKCGRFLEQDDLLWIVGCRRQAPTPAIDDGPQGAVSWRVGDAREVHQLESGPFDLIFSCPPYGDLEVYSTQPADLSAMKPAEFRSAYRECITRAAQLLAPDRFAVFVVGDYREKGARGAYRNFVSETIAAFIDAGLFLYNEAILVTAVGSLPIRTARMFEGARKLGKTHQNVLVFCKGDPVKATAAIGAVEFVRQLDAPAPPQEG